jgi:WD40 repeat protein
MVWNAVSGKELLTLRGHLRDVHGVVLSTDSKRVVIVSYDGTAKVWDAVSGQELFTLRGHSEEVRGAAFSPDGKRLATASKDKTVQIYALDPWDLLDLARNRVTRNLTPDECKRYFQSSICPPVP